MEKADKYGMRKLIIDFPKQFKVGLKATEKIKLKGKFENIVVSGMGGSALPAELLRTGFDLPIPLNINRTYDLPSQTNKNTLSIFISYSGNTEETLSSYKKAVKKKFPCAAITAGGELKKLCGKNKTQCVLVPAGFQPRMSTGYLISALAGILYKAKIISKKQVNELLDLEKNLKPKKLENKGERLAKKLFKKIPIIYTADRFRALGYVWKIKFNENSKTPAFCNYFAELNHNEMNGWQNPVGNFFVIILRDLKDHSRMLKRVEVTAKLIKSKGISVEIIDLPKGNDLTRIFTSLLLADWASYYLALEYKTDPIKVKIIEEFKKRL
ncbi:MAG: bifunctional phosphoglucose/phosphomannose isomerase [Candidatus Aenigmarchaeota archaeon]|nr:bifunctional phosphoglucose/phosphomannose isomerase [Candidatus Aenigmarchaeota archaeon]